MKYAGKISLIIAILTIGSQLKAQDIHLSQYDAAPLMLNPALTGIIDNGQFRIGANYRTQWGSIAFDSYGTTVISLDTKVDSRWAVGGFASNNDLGGFLNVFNFMLSGRYEITDPIQNKFRILTGLQVGIIHKKIDLKEYVFDSQYEDGNFDEDIQSGESFEKRNLVLPDLNWGIAYINVDRDWKVKPYGGVSLSHLFLAKESFGNANDDRMPIKYAFNAGATYRLNPKLMFDVRSLYMMQRNFRELDFGTLVYYKLNERDYTLVSGIDIRWQDAFIFNVGIKRSHIMYKLSYDFNTSSLHRFTGGYGGMEVSIIYTPGRVIRTMPQI